MPPPPASTRCLAAYRDRWGSPELVARAPGRVNIIGEHTDYNDGFTLPMALPFDTVIAAASVGEPDTGRVTLVSEGFGETTIDPTADPRLATPWARHVAGVVGLLRDAGVPGGGWQATVATDIPTGASLSSSAAIEVAIITMLLRRAGVSWTPIDIARLGQRVENEVIDLPSGIMDQFISAAATAGCASLMDCRSLTLTPVPLPDDVVVAVMDTGTRRILAEAAYAERREACGRAVRAIGVPALRDAVVADLELVDDVIDRRRARHVIEENARTLAAAEAMKRDDAAELGRLMTTSHVSLRDLYEVSGPGLDAIVDVAVEAPGCFGARMTGGGFAGCAVAIVDAAEASSFADHVIGAYDHEGHTARVWLCEPAAGASLLIADPVSDE